MNCLQVKAENTAHSSSNENDYAKTRNRQEARMESEKSTFYLDQGRFEPLLNRRARPQQEKSLGKYTSDVVSYRYETIFEIDKVRDQNSLLYNHSPSNKLMQSQSQVRTKKVDCKREASVRRLFNKVSSVAFL
jgi:hypothetical protein